MERLAKQIMQYINEEFSVSKPEQEILQFGIEAAIEIAINIVVSFLILWKMQMIVEGIIFFAVFIPTRMLAGGYHSKGYWQCLIFSSVTLIMVMTLSKYVHFVKEILIILILLMELLIGMLGPIVNAERPVTRNEYIIFTKKLAKVFVVIAFFSIGLSCTKYYNLLNIVFLSLCLIFCSSILGKIKYKQNQI